MPTAAASSSAQSRIKTERCTGFRPVQNLAGEMKKVRDVAATNIEKPLSLIPIAATAPGGEPVILVFVPKSTSLLAVTTNKKAEFWKRIGTDKREMTYAEIEQARTLGYEAAEQDRKRQRSLAPNLTRWNEINDVDLLRQLMSQRFRGAIESERWLRSPATRLQLTTDRVDTGNDSLRSTIQFPVSGQRDTGWFLGIGAGLRQVFPTPLGFESKESSQAKEIPPGLRSRDPDTSSSLFLSSRGYVSVKGTVGISSKQDLIYGRWPSSSFLSAF